MRYLGSVLAMLAAGIWVGGILCVAVFAQSTFKVLADQRDVAGTVTSQMFVRFGWIQLTCAALGLLGAFLMYVGGRRGSAMVVFGLLAAASIGAVAYNMWLVPKMEALRQAGQSSGPEFKQLHDHSRTLLMGTGLAALAALAVIPRAIGAEAKTAV
ncbi:MAG: DUF4149 domain-containing protein [Phycisphaerae bacterium]